MTEGSSDDAMAELAAMLAALPLPAEPRPLGLHRGTDPLVVVRVLARAIRALERGRDSADPAAGSTAEERRLRRLTSWARRFALVPPTSGGTPGTTPRG